MILPFISSVNELRRAKALIDFPFKLGIMIDSPAAALKIEDFCKEEIDFVSIGLKSLIQLVLGIDSDNTKTSSLYSELDPAVTGLIEHIVKVCRQYNVETSVYSESINSQIIETFIKLGVGSISIESDMLEEAKSITARTERKLLLDNLRNR